MRGVCVCVCVCVWGGGGGLGVLIPWKITQNEVVFFRNTGPDPKENYIATKPTFLVWLTSARKRNYI